LNTLLAGIAVGMLAVIAVVFAAILLAATARADDTPAPMRSPADARQGSLLFKAEGGYVAAPIQKTDVSITVTGMIARARVSQHFRNPAPIWMEGIYVFPLPENAAVDHLDMRVGERLIEGQIHEREAARRTYEAAKSEGKKAALLEQERPNIFTSSVANIGPAEEVTVTIEYQQTLQYDQGTYRLRFPMVVAPRYIPGNAIEAGANGTGWSPDTDQVRDASRITPPVQTPGKAPLNPVSLTVELDAGFPLARLESPFHAIDVTALEGNRKRISLASGTVPATRDFELVWTPDSGNAPGAAVFSQERLGKHYALVMVMPPLAAATHAEHPAREVVFVIDTSGSMHGTSISQAREALLLALSRLTPRDRFNVIEFNSILRELYKGPVDATPEAIAKAQQFVRSLEASGGTEMAPALKAALVDKEDSNRLRQVVFLTDGEVGNEEALFELIRTRLGRTRLFTVGIGSAPNAHFMTKAAEFGHGTFTYIGDVSQVAEKMGALFAKLESPVLTDIAVQWPAGSNVESWPARLPDLYAGEPVVLAASLASLQGEVTVTGQRAGAPWKVTLPLSDARPDSGADVLWARRKIESLLDSVHEGHDPGEVRAAVVATAIDHHLVSKYTSLVAVDVTPSRPADAESGSAAVPVNLPDGMSYDKVFGQLPQTATPAQLHLLIGAVLLALAAVLWALARKPALVAR
jgi:Ca-activated chloride channel family protein